MFCQNDSITWWNSIRKKGKWLTRFTALTILRYAELLAAMQAGKHHDESRFRSGTCVPCPSLHSYCSLQKGQEQSLRKHFPKWRVRHHRHYRCSPRHVLLKKQQCMSTKCCVSYSGRPSRQRAWRLLGSNLRNSSVSANPAQGLRQIADQPSNLWTSHDQRVPSS